MRLGRGAVEAAQAGGKVGRGAAQGIAFGQQRRKRGGGRACHAQHMAKPRMQRQGGEVLSMRGDAPRGIKRAQIVQERLRLGQNTGVGRGQERQISRPPERQFQRKGGQIGGLDLGRGERGERALFAARPQAVAAARGHPPCPAPALFGLGPCHPFGDQPRHARGGVEPRPARAAAIDDHADVGDGQRGFGDGGGQNDLALGCGGKGCALGGELHRAKQRKDPHIGQALQQAHGAANLAFAGQEHQDAARGFGDRLPDQARQSRLEAQGGIGGARQPVRVHRKGAPLRGDQGRLSHQGRDGGGIKGGGHHQKLQVGAERAADFQTERQPQIGIERAFVEFVEDDEAHARQFGVRLNHAGQDAFGDHFDPGGGAAFGLAADAVADGLAHRLAKAFGHPLGRGAGREAAGFEHHDAPRGLGQKGEGDARGLARPRRGLQYGLPRACHGRQKGGKGIVDGQAVTHDIRVRAGGGVMQEKAGAGPNPG